MSDQPEVFVDTDMGLGTPVSDVDDAFALALLLAAERRRECKVVGVAATFGNVPLSEALPNAAALLRALDREDVPLVSGVDGPMLQDIRKLRDRQRAHADPSFATYRRSGAERGFRAKMTKSVLLD
jgi:inosine-uridine nucleoside N-ribohydrolase